jgi:hypothetical protein
MNGANLVSWWKNKGIYIVNKRVIDLIGQGIGYVPIENLFTDEELSEIGVSRIEDRELIEAMRDDGISFEPWEYQNGDIEFRFKID